MLSFKLSFTMSLAAIAAITLFSSSTFAELVRHDGKDALVKRDDASDQEWQNRLLAGQSTLERLDPSDQWKLNGLHQEDIETEYRKYENYLLDQQKEALKALVNKKPTTTST
jgi:hypothetical protein